MGVAHRDYRGGRLVRQIVLGDLEEGTVGELFEIAVEVPETVGELGEQDKTLQEGSMA